MHKSIALYAKALGCTPGQVRRYIRHDAIPSAKLIRSRFGRPSWSIPDCSPATIANLKLRIAVQRSRRAPVIFQEPVPSLTLRESQDGRGVLGAEIIWQPMWRSLRSYDTVHARHDILTRMAMLSEGLSWHDIRNPNTTRQGAAGSSRWINKRSKHLRKIDSNGFEDGCSATQRTHLLSSTIKSSAYGLENL